MSEKSVFEKLSSINVSKLVKSKNGFNYLSWASALETLYHNFPSATFDIKRFNGLPYLQTDLGYFVEVEVIIDEIARSVLHPVLDFRNKPITKPNTFEINSSIQRALAKCIALHGLGLNIFVGEDLPLSEREAIADAQDQLRSLLKENNAYESNFESHLMKMTYDQLISKINVYRDK